MANDTLCLFLSVMVEEQVIRSQLQRADIKTPLTVGQLGLLSVPGKKNKNVEKLFNEKKKKNKQESYARIKVK